MSLIFVLDHSGWSFTINNFDLDLDLWTFDLDQWILKVPTYVKSTQCSQAILLTKVFIFEFFKQIPLLGHSSICPVHPKQSVNL